MKELKDIVLKKGDIVTLDDGEKQCFYTNFGFFADDVYDKKRIVKIERVKEYETIYEAPKEILDKKEKEYLEAVIRPFRDKEPRIWKVSMPCKKAYISIGLDNSTHIHLPYFNQDVMYKGMELDKSYTLEELGLFKE